VDGTAANTHGILEPAAGRARFTLTRRLPADDLAGHVDGHWIVRWDLGGETFTQEILPHPSVNLVSEPGLIAVWGIPLGRSPHHLAGSGMAVGTKFAPGAFSGFIDTPASKLNGRVVALADLFGDTGAQLEHELVRCAGNPHAHIEAVERFLRERRPAPDPRHELVMSATRAILAAPQGTTVAELADRFGVSRRTLQRLFREYVGVGPKWVLKRYRMHEAAERIAAGEVEDHASLALELGYYDQAHFIRDFSAQIGRSPRAYGRACAAAAGAPAIAARTERAA
jgi:AraC-like DNA-binding protein